MWIELSQRNQPMAFHRLWKYLALVGVSAGLIILSSIILTPYSYWLDELYSVNASSRNWKELYYFIMSDVHPPLYQVILKCWISMFGAEEVATRTLSWIFSVATLILVHIKTKRYGDIFQTCALLAIASNVYFSHYGNEVRSYSMLMFCSTLIALTMPIERSRSASNIFLISCIIASWVHYFGLLLSIVALTYYFLFNIEGLSGRVKVMACGLIMTFWPLHHIVNGALLGKSGGDFWITSGGFMDTVRFASTAIVPSDLPFSGYIFAGLMLWIFFNLLRLTIKKNSTELAATKLGLQAFAVWIGLIILVGLIDLHTPMSTGRNFIVTVPFFSLSVAAAFSGISTTRNQGVLVLIAVVISCCALLLTKSLEDVSSKAQSPEDWRNATKVAIEQSSGKSLYVVQWGDEITGHYIRKFSNAEQFVHTYKIGETKINNPAVILFARLSPQLLNALDTDMRDAGGRRIFPEDNKKDGNRIGVYVVK